MEMFFDWNLQTDLVMWLDAGFECMKLSVDDSHKKCL